MGGPLRHDQNLNRVQTFLFVGRCLGATEESDEAELRRVLVGGGVDWTLVLSIASQQEAPRLHDLILGFLSEEQNA